MTTPASLTRPRISSIDLLRGLVMIIMALDHTRDFFHSQSLLDDPLNAATTTPALYFTRWITHFCAPAFVFIAGTSAWLQHQRKSTKELSWFLISRGGWLVLMEITIVTLGITGDIHFGFIILQTIWSIGISMVLLGLIIWLPYKAILVIGLVIVFGHNSFDFVEAARKAPAPLWWQFIHQPGFFSINKDHAVGIFYPFLPWAGLMMVGYCFGKVFTRMEAPRQNKVLLWTGMGLLVLFIVLRIADVYGDPLHWSRQSTTAQTIYSFMNVQKYPPSLLFMCATIGGALLFLSCVRNTGGRLSRIIMVYGRVPFFYYMLHFYLLNIIHVIYYLTKGRSLAEGMAGLPGLPFKFAVPGEGADLWVVYLIWLGVVAALYPLCKWYDRYKATHKDKKWLSYI